MLSLDFEKMYFKFKKSAYHRYLSEGFPYTIVETDQNSKVTSLIYNGVKAN